jgi:replicative DNA helicase
MNQRCSANPGFRLPSTRWLADMVILLHRESAYERDSPRAGEADLIVAKHRNGPTRTITVAFHGHFSRFADMVQG